MNWRIAVLPGDGVGSEVIDAAVLVLRATAERFGHEASLEFHDVGWTAYDRHGVPLPEDTLEAWDPSGCLLPRASVETAESSSRSTARHRTSQERALPIPSPPSCRRHCCSVTSTDTRRRPGASKPRWSRSWRAGCGHRTWLMAMSHRLERKPWVKRWPMRSAGLMPLGAPRPVPLRAAGLMPLRAPRPVP